MVSGLVLHKVGMTQIFDENGRPVPVTVLKLSGGRVVRLKEVNGKKRVVLAFGECKMKNIPKPIQGILKKAGIEDKGYKVLKEFDLTKADQEITPGQKLGVDVFQVGDIVDVTGKSKGRGFQGVVKRWGAKGGPATHGSMSHRRPGAIGQRTDPGRVWKGMKMPGHMGMKTVTVKNLKVVVVDAQNDVIAVKGSVPSWVSASLIVRKAKKGGSV
ncbi:MAG: 50S ribosomal protein L3 [Candidatus Calescibacterium sp.]|nr:50S ribosomal protein L3 [Candidatus Calescibacterium sp.]MCX7734711.1 50S ribosomal protein L3 [bacterium]MDW8087307.1 50S ribosomal protein L3 [Candidatus Calescibacterium sp.]